MDRRLTGTLVLAATVLLALVLPVFLRAPSPGRAVSADLGTPGPGSCVSSVTAGALRVVDCADPHTGEVPLVLTAVPPTPTGPGARAGRGPAASSCFGALPAYLAAAGTLDATRDSGWVPADLDYSVAVVGGAVTAGYPACVIEPLLPVGSPGYTGHLAAAQVSGAAPAGLHECFRSAGGPDLTGCAQAHAGELLATRILPASAGGDSGPASAGGSPATAPMPDPAELTRQCTAQAAALMARADPTLAGRLHVVATAAAVRPPGGSAGPVVERLTCTAWAATGWTLTGSLFGLGGAAPPLRAVR